MTKEKQLIKLRRIAPIIDDHHQKGDEYLEADEPDEQEQPDQPAPPPTVPSINENVYISLPYAGTVHFASSTKSFMFLLNKALIVLDGYVNNKKIKKNKLCS